MRILADYVLPLLVVALGYIGVQRFATKSHWSMGLKITFHIIAIFCVFVLLIYEYFAGRPLVDSLREAAGNAFCRTYTIESCPAAIKMEVALRNADYRRVTMEVEAKLKQAQDERLKADAELRDAKEERRRTETLLVQVQEERRKSEQAARDAAEARRLTDLAPKQTPTPAPVTPGINIYPPAASEVNPRPPNATLPPEDSSDEEVPSPQGRITELPPNLHRQMVRYQTRESRGTIVVDTSNTYLYLVLGDGIAMRYGVAVGATRDRWSGVEYISRMAEWPDWRPTKETRRRYPYLPEVMAGGEGNPLGARALYLGSTLYRIHGTNRPSTIGMAVTTGSIRLTNEDIIDLYSKVQVGARVVVLP
jgi:lipoprotein-anchoring transpeptidase ErfK/SrfK